MCGLEMLLGLGGSLVASKLLAPKAPDISGALARNASAVEASNAAILESQKALADAKALTLPGADSEAARRAYEAQLRKGSDKTTFAGASTVAPSLTYKQLFGD